MNTHMDTHRFDSSRVFNARGFAVAQTTAAVDHNLFFCHGVNALRRCDELDQSIDAGNHSFEHRKAGGAMEAGSCLVIKHSNSLVGNDPPTHARVYAAVPARGDGATQAALRVLRLCAVDACRAGDQSERAPGV